MEKRAAKRCLAGNSGERIADVPHPPHHWQMDAIFSPVVARIFDHCASDDLLSPPSGLSHRFLACVDTIVLFILSETSKEYLS